MKTLDALSKQKPHRILTGVTVAVSALSLFVIDNLLFGKHLTALKRYDVSGDLAPYLAELFSDPVILLAAILSVLLLGLNLAVTVRAFKRSESGAFLHALCLLLNIIVFFALLYKMMFAS